MQDHYLFGIVLIVISSLELFLSVYLTVTNYRNEIRRWYSLFTFCISIWVGSLGLSLIFTTKEAVTVVGYFPWISGICAVVALLGFSWVFPVKTKRLTFLQWLILLLPILIFSILIFSSFAPVVQETQLTKWRTNEKGPSYNLYNISITIFILWAFINLLRKHRISDGIHKWQLKYLIVGIAISSFAVIMANILMPWLKIAEWELFESFIGPTLSIVWLGFTSYIIFRKKI